MRMKPVSDSSAAGPLPELPPSADEPVEQSSPEAAIRRHLPAMLDILSENGKPTPETLDTQSTSETRAAKFANSSSDGNAPQATPSRFSPLQPKPYDWDSGPLSDFVRDAFRMGEPPQSDDGSYVRRDVFNLSGLNGPVASSDARTPFRQADGPSGEDQLDGRRDSRAEAFERLAEIIDRIGQFGFEPNGNRTYYRPAPFDRLNLDTIAARSEGALSGNGELPLDEAALARLRAEHGFWIGQPPDNLTPEVRDGDADASPIVGRASESDEGVSSPRDIVVDGSSENTSSNRTAAPPNEGPSSDA
jgi:hypothetical protein